MALIVKTSQLPNSGKGLFTTTAIKKGTEIIEYLGEIIDWKEYERRVELDEDGYLFFISKKRCIDAYNTRQHKARFANDAAGLGRVKGLTNNSIYEIQGDRCFIIAKKDIPAGSEIFVSYTKEYWDCVKYNISIGRGKH